MRQIRVASVQFEHKNGDKEANLATIRKFADKAAASAVAIVVFPECCITGYWFLRKLSREQIVDLAEPVYDGPSSQALIAMSRERKMTIGAGLIELGSDGELYNSYVVAMPDGTTACHRKLHCFISQHMSSGADYTVFDSHHGCKLGVLICYDNNIIENVRITALKGADIILAPHQTGGCQTGDPHTMGVISRKLWDQRDVNPAAIKAEFCGEKGRGWLMRWLPSRAHDNGVFLIFSNGVGVDDNEVRTGNAMILDTYGRVLAETWKAGDDMVVANLDPELRANSSGVRWRRTRRPDLYAPITELTGEEEDLRKVRFFFEKE